MNAVIMTSKSAVHCKSPHKAVEAQKEIAAQQGILQPFYFTHGSQGWAVNATATQHYPTSATPYKHPLYLYNTHGATQSSTRMWIFNEKNEVAFAVSSSVLTLFLALLGVEHQTTCTTHIWWHRRKNQWYMVLRK